MKNMKTIAVICGMLAVLVGNAQELPKGWIRAGSKPTAYDMSIDRNIAHSGKASATVKCISTNAEGFGTLMQMFKADAFKGKRVRFSGYVRSQDVAKWAGLWMRVDGPVASGTSVPETIAFDNMQQRPIKNTMDWQKYDIVLDIPERAQEIAFGILLDGKGQVWIDDLKFEEVTKDVPTTGTPLQPALPPMPKNLDFEN